jgi:hypothetical protein
MHSIFEYLRILKTIRVCGVVWCVKMSSCKPDTIVLNLIVVINNLKNIKNIIDNPP